MVLWCNRRSDNSDWYMVARTPYSNTTITNLVMANVYHLRVIATTEDDDGNSTWSKEMQYHTDYEHVDVPSIVALTFQSSNSHSLTVGWSAPINDGGAEILRYELTRDNGNNGSSTEVTLVASATSRVITFVDLTPLLYYRLHIRAINSYGACQWSEPLIINTTAPEPPSPPHHVVVTDVDGQSVTLVWHAEATSYGVPLLAYQVVMNALQFIPADVLVCVVSYYLVFTLSMCSNSGTMIGGSIAQH
jgi:hypothetical protein